MSCSSSVVVVGGGGSGDACMLREVVTQPFIIMRQFGSRIEPVR